MGILDPTFLLGLVIILYLASFLVFALLRIATGISIQRIGYFSLRRIAYTPREGIKITIRGLGLHLHRPSFAQPTWISLRLDELKVTVDVQALAASSSKAGKGSPDATPKPERSPSSSTSPKPILRRNLQDSSRSRAWKRLTGVKETLKKLHQKIHWFRLVDVFATNSSFVVSHVGAFELGTVIALVDTRRKTVDRGRLFQHKKIPAGDQRPAEWMFTVRGVLFTPEGKGSLEVLDIATLNIHGLLYKELPGLRDTSISLKLGRIHIPYDDFVGFHRCAKEMQSQAAQIPDDADTDAITFSDMIEELDRPGSREANIVQTVSDSKEFISSILRGIQEIQMAVSFVGMTKAIQSVQPSGTPMYLNFSMNEFGVDLHRLDAKSPAHRMYFSSRDVAHQALLAAISLSVSLDDGKEKPDRLLYVPMATTTMKTTLPSKTVAFSEDGNTAERNANILYANLVVTSPSIDVDPKHMPIVLAMTRHQQEKRDQAPRDRFHSHHLLSRLLPKASIKLSVHEPVIRVKLPSANVKFKDTDDYDLLISVVSSMSLDTESSHSAAGDLHYGLTSSLRLSSHQFYYQTAAGERHDLLLADSLELRAQVTADPKISVMLFGHAQKFSMHMVKPEISTGVRQIVKQVRFRHSPNTTELPSSSSSSSEDPDFLRPLPPWLVQLSLQGSDFSVEVAGMDGDVSEDIRGVGLQLESWTADYKQQRSTSNERPPSRRHHSKPPTAVNEPVITVTPPDARSGNPADTDGRRLAVHIHGLEGFVIDDSDTSDSESFLSLPRFEVAFSTSSDHEGPIFHINTYMKSFYVQYSLYRYYSIGVASTVLREAFALDKQSVESRGRTRDQTTKDKTPSDENLPQKRKRELLSVDLRSEFIQIKATMPADPPMMLQIFGVETGQHRWAKPFLRSRLVRLYAEAPQLQTFWARIIVIKTLRFDLREIKKKRGTITNLEKSFDLATDFIRFGVPHQLVMHKIVDNFVNVMKATQQLQHRFITGTNEYILKKKPEKPKELPRISVRSKVMLFEIEDGAFDWKLSMIYRIGLIEQKQRLAREEAYRAKVRHIEKCMRQGTSRQRDASHHTNLNGQRSQSEDHRGRRKNNSESTIRDLSNSPPRGRRKRMRYDPEGKCKLSEEAKVSMDEAYRRLQKHNAQSWKKRIDGSYQIAGHAMRDIRGIFWGSDELPIEDSSEKILAMPERPGLMASLISDLHIVLDKPSFPIHEYPEYLHKAGKGMPREMQYSLLIPMSVQIDMGEARVTLRDYPLPLLHVPAIRAGQSPRLPSWSLKTDFVIAEEYRGDACSKQIPVQIVPPGKFANPQQVRGFAVDVRRTVTPVKTYSDVSVAINTSAPTSITWGTSLQPAIQDMMMVIEGFSKPQVDPSDRVGFWDKIRLNVHSRVSVAWTGGGDVHLNLKGSRDPYVVTGHGAGFVMVWRQNVRWNIHRDDDDKKFMTVDSGEYVLAIPDFSRQARENVASTSVETDSVSSAGSYKDRAHFKKTVMKLGGEVRWLAGLVFERSLDDRGRSFDFMPHYDVILRPPEGVDLQKNPDYDAFKGFRSNFIHLSLAVIAPLNRDWTTTNTKPSNYYNATHLTPKFFTHFFEWWSLFSGVMSLPIRQGKLFPGPEKSSKKFGRHLATIKYNLLLSPLFITHMYKHKDVEEYSDDIVSATGLKLRLDSFMLDLHQRREEFVTQGKGHAKQIKTSAMKIHEVQLDFISADLRAVSAKIQGTSSDYITRATDEELAELHEPALEADVKRFHIPDQNFDWIDMDDFNELDWILPAENHPETHILPLAFAPRFTYFRQTDHMGTQGAEEGRSSKFGDEPTHHCVMSHENDPRKVQCHLVNDRLQTLEQQIHSHDRKVGEQELRVIRDTEDQKAHRSHYDELCGEGRRLQDKREFLRRMLGRLSDAVDTHTPWVTASEEPIELEYQDRTLPHGGMNGHRVESEPLEPSVSDFNNRFIIHNVQLKWNNSLRNIILRYVHQVSQRRGFIYYMTRRAVRFILDIVEEQNKSKHKQGGKADSSTTGSSTPASSIPPKEEQEDDSGVQDRIQELLNDGKRFVDADTSRPGTAESRRPTTAQPGQDVSDDFTPLKSYHVRLIAPQIQLQSEKNAKSVLLVTAKSMQLQVIQIMDKDRMADDVSGLVQRRFSVDMDGAQFFVTSVGILKDHHEIYLGNKYGAPKKDPKWPPWVPFEANFDFNNTPFGWARVVSKTSATLRYDKYNTLRLKYNDEVSGEKGAHSHGPDNPESRIDHLWVEFPHLRAICDSSQYFTMYVIVLDLLLYNEPLEKVRSERLEKIMLASDFSDLRGAPEMVTNLQGRIRQLEEIKTHFQVHKKYLDRQGWLDNQSIEQDLASCEDELFFMMKAITTSQRKIDDRAEPSQSSPYLQWYLSASEIVWHLMRQKEEPLMEIQFNNALYDRTDNSDGSNHNVMEIERMHGLNLLPDAIYPEMLGPYLESGRKFMDGQDPKMLKVSWHSLEAIAGIPVLDQFEVDLFPLRVQLERDIGQKLFEYIFPGVNKKDGGDGGFSPFMVKQSLPGNSDEDNDTADTASESIELPTVTLNGTNGDARPPNSPSFAMRLRATTRYPDKEGFTSSVADAKNKSPQQEKEHHFRFFQHSNQSNISTKLHKPSPRPQLNQNPGNSLAVPHKSREGSSTSLSTMGGSTKDKHNRFALKRSDSQQTATKKDQPSDDLSLMLSRASNYMTLAYVKIPSVVLCLSYKGKGERSIQDVHNFVFRMPVLEYRNKTWSNLDLALRLKKDVIRALISHTGAIIGNKFAHPRPSKTQRSKLQQFSLASSLLPGHDGPSSTGLNSETSSLYAKSPTTDPRSSFQSYPRSELSRTSSFASSLQGQAIQANANRPRSFVEPDAGEVNNTLQNLRRNMTRRFTADTERVRSRDGGAGGEVEDGDESNRKKSVLLLGKKILGGLNQQ